MYDARDEHLVHFRNEEDQVVAVRARQDAVTELRPRRVGYRRLRDPLKVVAQFAPRLRSPGWVVRRDVVADLLEVGLRLV